MAPSTNPSIWNHEIPVSAEVISYVDDAVKRKMPDNTQIVSITPSGSSYWARTAKIETIDPDGNILSFFIKVHEGAAGHKLVLGEYHSMNTLWNTMPELVARPYGYGTYEKMEDVHFFLCSFHELTGRIPDIRSFPGLVAELHRRKTSPDGTFGFPYETFGGRLPQSFPVTHSWEETFTAGMGRIFKSEEDAQGYDADMDQLRVAIMEKVIPRLVRPLEMGPNKIQPRLVHGDLWDGNCSVDVNTNLPVIFDATCLWAHNECKSFFQSPLGRRLTGFYRRTRGMAAAEARDERAIHRRVCSPVWHFRAPRRF
ncbi:putative fructosamine Ketosamine-3-kinase [Rosellinia necatrix]|uniref:protein-ribulosamine 3-kinase n=1 Tax=Rosellinia necatrix TaxID=77044 RepID=A0A1S8A5U9_ROSNE|nr:putative fructosamine Ketosamine-3-kinase [Rosellinia necatrix]